MKIIAEYIWIADPTNPSNLRSKAKTIVTSSSSSTSTSDEEEEKIIFPDWNFDGSSTDQATGDNSEVVLSPVKVVPDPFRGEPHVLVLCECKTDSSPHPTNTRTEALTTFQTLAEHHPWFGIEQEYTIFLSDGRTPIGWKYGIPQPQGPYYCSIGTRNAYGRDIANMHYQMCLNAGLSVSGINAEVMPGQWEYQIGPVEGIDAADQLWLSRYILIRVAELYECTISFFPKPLHGDWNGTGCHVNFSTALMRQEEKGYEHIMSGIEKLEKKHLEHIACYGISNNLRLTGTHETSSLQHFSYGVANRGCSIRIPRETYRNGGGYFEDRRPASNMDPYVVTAKITDTVCN